MTHAEHPLVAAHGANAAADLVPQCLKREPMIRRCERARDGIARPIGLLGGKEIVDRLLETASEQMFVPLKWDQAMPGTGPAGSVLCFRPDSLVRLCILGILSIYVMRS